MLQVRSISGSGRHDNTATFTTIDTSATGQRPYRQNTSVHGAPAGSKLSKRVKAPGANDNGGVPPVVIYGLPIVLILGALGFLTLRDRRRAES